MTDVDLTAPESPVSDENCHTSTGSMDMYDAYVQRVFQPVGCDDLEDPEQYCSDGFHPVHLDDHLGEKIDTRSCTSLATVDYLPYGFVEISKQRHMSG